MENTTVFYREFTGYVQEFSGTWSAVDGGIVLHTTPRSNIFVPFHQVVSIEQSFTGDVDSNEIWAKSLYSRLRKK